MGEWIGIAALLVILVIGVVRTVGTFTEGARFLEKGGQRRRGQVIRISAGLIYGGLAVTLISKVAQCALDVRGTVRHGFWCALAHV
jgi:hypothetical protein